MRKASNAECHREADTVGRGDPAGLLRRSAPRNDRGSLSLWLWVAAGFLFLALLWTALFIASRQIDARTVPLAPKEAKP